MTQLERELICEVARLRVLLLQVYPYIPLNAGGYKVQEELERAVMGHDYVERIAQAYGRRVTERNNSDSNTAAVGLRGSQRQHGRVMAGGVGGALDRTSPRGSQRLRRPLPMRHDQHRGTNRRVGS